METYRFFMRSSIEFVLQKYILEERKTMRHKFKIVKVYDRIIQQRSDVAGKEVPIVGIEAKIKEYIVNNLIVIID